MGDVAADDVEVVAAFLHDDRRELEGGEGRADARVVTGDETERVGVLERGVDAERHEHPVGRELAYRGQRGVERRSVRVP